MMDGNDTKELRDAFERASSGVAAKPKDIEVDLMAYVEHLGELEGTLDEKMEILRSIFSVLVGWVDMGFCVVFTEESCGKHAEPNSDSAQEGVSALESKDYERGQT